jgi:sulfite exporter TauE/SafE
LRDDPIVHAACASAPVLLSFALMNAWWAIASGLALGIASAPHCFAMCGPLAAFAAGTEPSTRATRIARHQLGRLLAYAALGAVAAESGAWVARLVAPRWMSIVLGALLALGMLATAFELTRGRRASRPVALGRAPRTPLVARVLNRLPREPMLVGAVAALLPCGSLYGGLLAASGTGSAANGAWAMAAFALASGVGLVAATSLASRASSLTARRVLASALVVGAMLVALRPIAVATQPSSATSVCHPR